MIRLLLIIVLGVCVSLGLTGLSVYITYKWVEDDAKNVQEKWMWLIGSIVLVITLGVGGGLLWVMRRGMLFTPTPHTPHITPTPTPTPHLDSPKALLTPSTSSITPSTSSISSTPTSPLLPESTTSRIFDPDEIRLLQNLSRVNVLI